MRLSFASLALIAAFPLWASGASADSGRCFSTWSEAAQVVRSERLVVLEQLSRLARARFGGEIVKSEVLGKRRLAYEIAKFRDGIYVLVNFNATPEVVAEPVAGVLMPERSAAGVAAGVQALLRQMPERSATRRYAERFSWDATTDGQLRLFQGITGEVPRMAAE